MPGFAALVKHIASRQSTGSTNSSRLSIQKLLKTLGRLRPLNSSYLELDRRPLEDRPQYEIQISTSRVGRAPDQITRSVDIEVSYQDSSQ